MKQKKIPNYGIRSKGMTTTLEVKEDTKVSASSNLSFYCYVTLKDSEQILIDLEETAWTNGSNQKTGVIKKVRLEKLTYQSGYQDSVVSLYALEVRGFRKDKGLRFRSDMVYSLDQKVIDQIPNDYHNYAVEAFNKEVKELQDQLTHMTNQGVKIG